MALSNKLVCKHSKAFILGLAMFLFSPMVFSHGGVTIEEDRCVFRSDRYLIHFTAYQPQVSDRKEFCNKIPTTDKTIIVVDFVDEALRSIPMTVSVERQVGEEFIPITSLVKKLYPIGSMHISLSDVKKGHYRLLVNSSDSHAVHKHVSQHKGGVFSFIIEDGQAAGLEKGFIQQNTWILYLAFAGVLIFLVANWYRNRT